MAENFRYKGLKPFTENDKHLFFGRTTENGNVLKKIHSEKIVVIHSKPGFGKTSLINAGIITDLKQKSENLIFSHSFKNYIKSTDLTPSDSFSPELDKIKTENCYLDKLLEDKKSIWVKLKKIQASHKEIKQIFIFFDQFENLFSYPQNEIDEFIEQLSISTFSQIPENFKQIIQDKVLNDSGFLTEEGMKLLYKQLEIKIIIGIRSDKLSLLTKFENNLPGILHNCYELPALNEISAKEAIIKPAEFESKYSSQNNFFTKKFTLSENLIDEIIKSLTNNQQKQIETYQLQIICENIEKIVLNKQLDKVELQHIGDVSALYKNYYDNLIEKITDNQQQTFARIFIEDELILKEEERRLSVYQGVAINKFRLAQTTLDILVQNQLLKTEQNQRDEIFYEISHDALVSPILKAKEKRIEKQIRLEEELKQQVKLQEIAEKEHLKVQRNRKISTFVSIALLITLFLAIYALAQKKKSDKSAIISKSNLLASYALQELPKDPTLSLRLAQQAYLIDKNNSVAYSTLINAFYETNVFYNILGEINNYVEAAYISNDGKNILYISNDYKTAKYKVIMTDINGKTIREFPHIDNISTAVFSPDNKNILTACWDSVARIWDTQGNIIKTFENHKTILNSASYSPDGKLIATTGNDNKAVIWDLEGNKITELIGHELYVRSAEFSTDGNFIVTAAEDNTARVWDLTGKQLSVCFVEEEKYFFNTMILSARFTNFDNNILLVSNAFVNTNHTARLFDFAGNELCAFRGHTNWVNYVDISDNDEFIVTTSKDNDVIIWNKIGKQIYILKGHKASVFCARFVENNTKLITASADGTIREWTFNQEPNIFNENEEIKFASFSPSGIYITGIFYNKLKIFDLLGEEILAIDNTGNKIKTAFISNDYKNIITTEKDSTAKIYDFEGKLQITLDNHTDKVNTAVFSSDNSMFLTSSDDKYAKLWNSQGKVITEFKHSEKVNTAYFSPDSKYIITSCNDSTAKLWNLKGDLIHEFKGHNNNVTSASVSPDNKFVITTGDDATARLWSIDGEELFIFKGYESRVNSAEFSPDGKYIITSSNDKTIRLWDLSGIQIMIFNHEGSVLSASFSPNGKYILSVYYDENSKLKSKMWLVNSDEICKHIDELKRYGNIWSLDEKTKNQYNITE